MEYHILDNFTPKSEIHFFNLIRITEDAFYYKDEKIEDAGEIYKILSEVCTTSLPVRKM